DRNRYRPEQGRDRGPHGHERDLQTTVVAPCRLPVAGNIGTHWAMADHETSILPFTTERDRGLEQLRLSADHLVKVYKGRQVVRDVSVDIRQGEIVGLLGPNGAGKTTTFYMIVGLVQPDGGRVLLADEDITSLPMYLRAQRGISYLPQEPS